MGHSHAGTTLHPKKEALQLCEHVVVEDAKKDEAVVEEDELDDDDDEDTEAKLVSWIAITAADKIEKAGQEGPLCAGCKLDCRLTLPPNYCGQCAWPATGDWRRFRSTPVAPAVPDGRSHRATVLGRDHAERRNMSEVRTPELGLFHLRVLFCGAVCVCSSDSHAADPVHLRRLGTSG